MAKHFADERWFDYVRGLSPPDEVAAIERHLQEGCQACNRLVQFWRTVKETAASEAAYQVNEDAVRIVQAAYRDWRRRYVLPKRARMARLIFDSLLEPLPSGARVHSSQTRRLLQRTGQWLVNLRLEPGTDTRMSVKGQVLQSRKAPRVRTRLAILLMSADRLLGETSAKESGEFQLEFDRAKDLRVYIDIPGQRPIGIQLPDPDEPAAAVEN